ncbi:MAG TPA: DUF1330 domain-containing protein [Actinobacteria bacterium]|nr:DUF1330 domain-containing protein [Actinomycetota bacterium]
MSALLIINYNVTDPDALVGYRDAAVEILVGPDRGTLRVVTHETIDLGEGDGAGTTTVILEFASVEVAREIFDSPEYQAIIGDRLAATEPKHAYIVPTLEA